MQGSVKYQIEGAKLTIETGVEANGKITRYPISDLHFHNRDDKGNLISIEIFGLSKVARSEKAVNFGEWGKPEKSKKVKSKKEKKK